MIDKANNNFADDIRVLLLDSLLGLPFAVDWSSGNFVHVGPQIETLLGYSQDHWKTVQDWVDCIHPDDSERAMNYCVSQSEQCLNHEFEYRMIKQNGDIIWVRDVVNIAQDNDGNVKYLIGFIIDITDDKNTQIQIISDKNKYQRLTLVDHLTKAYNRRKFDSYLIDNWNKGMRGQEPLSLIIIDIDHFKQFNDLYGHTLGDKVLVKVADAMLDTFKREYDTVCRIGGEEFAAILPNTSIETALELAQKLQDKIADHNISHEHSHTSPLLTVSMGVSEAVNYHNYTSQQFYAFVDDLMYSAKNSGRNRIVSETFSEAASS